MAESFEQGTLDLLANRSMASGVHAWTESDYTCYTLSNAGSEGFLSVLPIYIDHLLYPTLTVSLFEKFSVFFFV